MRLSSNLVVEKHAEKRRHAERCEKPPAGNCNSLANMSQQFEKVIDQICCLPWENISEEEVLRVALAYYYFSIQFRENLEIACSLFPSDPLLARLREEECDTSNLSPWDGVAAAGEKMNHDEFMRRLLSLQPLPETSTIVEAGTRYLHLSRNINEMARARSIASYEDGGLERVFSSILRAPSWRGAGQRAFRFFLEQHIKFDSNEGDGHGALSRHIPADDSVVPLWCAFFELLKSAVAIFSLGTTRPKQ